jgi:phosphate ABC transporter permease protein PstC
MNDTRRERVIHLLLAVCAWSAVISLGVITIFIFQAGLPLIAEVGIPDFLFNAVWEPTAKPPSFGILSMVIGSIWLTIGALIVGVPLGIAVTIFMTDLAPPSVVAVMRPAVQLLAGIPSVIYGFVGLTTLAPVVRTLFGGPGLSVLTGALILGIMILPTVISISEDAVRAVPPALRQGALALGATRWQMLIGVVLPAARSGIVASIILAMGRALGETMAVIMMIGNALRIPTSFLDAATTLTSNIGLEMAYAGGAHREALFATGAVLFLLIMGLNSITNAVVRRGGARRSDKRA